MFLYVSGARWGHNANFIRHPVQYSVIRNLQSIAPPNDYLITISPSASTSNSVTPHVKTVLTADTLLRWGKMQGHNPKIALILDLSMEDLNNDNRQDELREYRNRQDKNKVSMQVINSYNDLCSIVNLKPDALQGIRDTNNINTVMEVWNTLVDKGYIYKGSYTGWFSKDGKHFSRIAPISKVIINDTVRIIHDSTGDVLLWQTTECYKFNFAKVYNSIKALYSRYYTESIDNEKKTFLQPPQIHEFMCDHLYLHNDQACEDFPLSMEKKFFRRDFCVSPPGDDAHALYPWFIKLCSYITASNALRDNPKRKPLRLKSQIVSDDLIHIYSLYWPAILTALNIQLPEHIIYHENDSPSSIRESSLSTSKTIYPHEAISLYGLDAVRMVVHKSSDNKINAPFVYSSQYIVSARKKIISSLICNYLMRLTSNSLNKNCTYPTSPLDQNNFILAESRNICNIEIPKILNHLQNCNLKYYCMKLTDLMHSVNSIFTSSSVWSLTSTSSVLPEVHSRYQTIMYALFENFRVLLLASRPVIPDITEIILDALQIPGNERTADNIKFGSAYLNTNPPSIPEHVEIKLKQFTEFVEKDPTKF